MRRLHTLSFVLFAATGTTWAAMLPGDAARGQALHERYCTACHDSRAYTRPNHTIKSVEGLMGRVRLCNQQLGNKLDRAQVNDIVKYLNDAYYRFP